MTFTYGNDLKEHNKRIYLGFKVYEGLSREVRYNAPWELYVTSYC